MINFCKFRWHSRNQTDWLLHSDFHWTNNSEIHHLWWKVHQRRAYQIENIFLDIDFISQICIWERVHNFIPTVCLLLRQSKKPLVLGFQHITICHQWTIIDGTRKDWLDHKLGVLAQIMAILEKKRDFETVFIYCLFGVDKIIFLFSFLCLIWHVIERYGQELSTVQRWASNSQYWWSCGTLNF